MRESSFFLSATDEHDPFGHCWFVSAEIQKVSPEEMQRRFAAMMQGQEG